MPEDIGKRYPVFRKTLINHKILPLEDVDYLYKQYQIFLTEYYYWRVCIKIQKILYNDFDYNCTNINGIENVIIKNFNMSDAIVKNNEKNHRKFILSLEKKARQFADKDGI